MQQSFESAVEEIMRSHPEYAEESYSFVRESMETAKEQFGKTGENTHVSAKELYMGTCKHALEAFGPLAPEVLAYWGVSSSDDIGAIVYNLIEAGVFGRSKGDTREQFHDLPPLREVLDEPYCPPNALSCEKQKKKQR